MKRCDFITLLGGAAAWPIAARAQQAAKVWRVGMLETVSATLNAANFDAFTRAMRDLGYVERENLVIEYRSADGSAERFPDLANELVRLSVDLIVTRGTPAALAAKKSTTTIPIVMAASGEPLGSGLIASLARPGGNLTGLSALTSNTYSKRVELLKEIVPGAVHIVALLNMSNVVHVSEWSEIEKAALRLGLVSQLSDIRKRQQIEPAFDTASRQRADALLVANDTLTQSNRRLIVELATKHRLPAMYAAREFIDAGGSGRASDRWHISEAATYRSSSAGRSANTTGSRLWPRELVGQRVAVIAANGGARASLAAKTTTLPILFSAAFDPVAVVVCLNRPGGDLAHYPYSRAGLQVR